MATKQEIADMRAKLKADRRALIDVNDAIENAIESLREAEIILDDMADEIADLSSDAPLCIKCGSVTVTGEPTWKAEAREDA